MARIFRMIFGTHLSAAGVHPRVAMAATCPAKLQRSWMRHSRIELTMNLPSPRLRQAGLYTDPVLLDVAGAVKTLPGFAVGPHCETRCPQARLA